MPSLAELADCTHIYVMHDGQRAKIGVTRRLDQRVNDIRTHQRGMKLVASYWHEVPAVVEALVKEDLAGSRSHGNETFSVTSDEAIDAVEAAMTGIVDGRIPKNKMWRDIILGDRPHVPASDAQVKGVAAAKARGVRFGKAKVITPEVERQIERRIADGERVVDIAASLGVVPATVRQYFKADRLATIRAAAAKRKG